MLSVSSDYLGKIQLNKEFLEIECTDFSTIILNIAHVSLHGRLNVDCLLTSMKNKQVNKSVFIFLLTVTIKL